MRCPQNLKADFIFEIKLAKLYPIGWERPSVEGVQYKQASANANLRKFGKNPKPNKHARLDLWL